MSVYKMLYIGASGMAAHSEAISVASNNIANMNTVGFKSGRARFEDVIGGTIAGGVQGVRLGGVDARFSQGALLGTNSSTDLAIQGDGFFVLKDSVDGKTFYTRDGQLNIDVNGNLVNSRGLVLQGYNADSNQSLSPVLEDLSIPMADLFLPEATTEVELGLNLNPTPVVQGAFDVNNPQATADFATSVTVYDSLGAAHSINVFFKQTASGNWDWHALADGAEMRTAPGEGESLAGQNVKVAGGTLVFNESGALVNSTQDAAQDNFNFMNAEAGEIAFSFGPTITGGSTGLEGSTSVDSASSVASVAQNGLASGDLVGLNVGLDGTIMGNFSNGEERVMGAVTVARFINNQGLIRHDAGNWAESYESGVALVGLAGVQGRGTIFDYNLENSNVQLAEEFVKIISFQRGFQASSRSIRTADELLSEAVTLKR